MLAGNVVQEPELAEVQFLHRSKEKVRLDMVNGGYNSMTFMLH